MPIPDFAPPADLELGAPFWAGLADGVLRLPRCGACGAWQWYPPDGPHCRDAALEWVDLPGTGTVFTHTTIRRPFLPGNDAEDVPFVVVLVEPDGAPGVRVVGNLLDGCTPAIGMPVVVGKVRARRGTHPVFRPADGAAG